MSGFPHTGNSRGWNGIFSPFTQKKNWTDRFTQQHFLCIVICRGTFSENPHFFQNPWENFHFAPFDMVFDPGNGVGADWKGRVNRRDKIHFGNGNGLTNRGFSIIFVVMFFSNLNRRWTRYWNWTEKLLCLKRNSIFEQDFSLSKNAKFYKTETILLLVRCAIVYMAHFPVWIVGWLALPT